jgi:hypothetical protein
VAVALQRGHGTRTREYTCGGTDFSHQNSTGFWLQRRALTRWRVGDTEAVRGTGWGALGSFLFTIRGDGGGRFDFSPLLPQFLAGMRSLSW